MPGTNLVLIRHADAATPGAPLPMMSGQTNKPLSPLGRRQVECLVARMAREPSVAAVYSSHLRRALETAQPVACVTSCDLRVDAGLGEIHCGEVDGLPVAEVESRYPELWEANLRQDDDGFAWPGGETYAAFRGRCLAAVEAISRQHRGARVALVTHAGVIAQLVGVIRGRPAAQWEACRPDNASLTEISWSGGSGRVLVFNDRAHLSPLASRSSG